MVTPMTTQFDAAVSQTDTSDDSSPEILFRRSDLLQRAQELSRSLDRRVQEMIGLPASASKPPADR
jgi:hypothetical protein